MGSSVMPGERLTLWTSASAAAATMVAVVVTALVFWSVTAKERIYFATELAALNAKVEKTNETVTGLKEAIAHQNTAKELELLSSEIKKTNKELVDIQKASSLDGIKRTLAQLDSKIDKTSEAVAEIKKITALQNTAKELELLSSEIKKTNNELADIQKASSLDGIKRTLAQLDSKIEKTSEAVAEIKKITAHQNTAKELELLSSEIKKTNNELVNTQKAFSLDGIEDALAQLNSKIENIGASLAEIKKTTAMDGIKTEFHGIKAELASLATRVDAKTEESNKTLAEIKAASLHAGHTQSVADAAREESIAKLNTAIEDIKGYVDDNASSQNKSLDMIVKSIDTLKASAIAQKAGKDLQAFHAPELPATETTSSILATQPMTVRFDKVGRTNLTTQTNTIIANLKTIMKGRHDCSISVAGHTDTLGRDDVNLDVSKERADAVAAKLKRAFAGQQIQINSIGWGERRLKIWTPDGTSEMANRRVDLSVDCKG
jgi:outer membrane protein OmpA-like peptidoglycan-associated protein